MATGDRDLGPPPEAYDPYYGDATTTPRANLPIRPETMTGADLAGDMAEAAAIEGVGDEALEVAIAASLVDNPQANPLPGDYTLGLSLGGLNDAPLASVRMGEDDTARALIASVDQTVATPRTIAASVGGEEEMLAAAIAQSLSETGADSGGVRAPGDPFPPPLSGVIGADGMPADGASDGAILAAALRQSEIEARAAGILVTTPRDKVAAQPGSPEPEYTASVVTPRTETSAAKTQRPQSEASALPAGVPSPSQLSAAELAEAEIAAEIAEAAAIEGRQDEALDVAIAASISQQLLEERPLTVRLSASADGIDAKVEISPLFDLEDAIDASAAAPTTAADGDTRARDIVAI